MLLIARASSWEADRHLLDNARSELAELRTAMEVAGAAAGAAGMVAGRSLFADVEDRRVALEGQLAVLKVLT